MAYPSPAGLRVNSIVLAFALVAGKFVVLRLFTRLVILQKAGLDDLFIGFAMLFAISLTTITAIEITRGLGKHVTQLTDHEVNLYLQTFWASIWMYHLALFATKLSILTQYFKLFPTERFQKICKIVLVVVIVFGIWSFLGSILLCFPVDFFWDQSVRHGRCMNRRTVWFANAALNMAQNLVLLLLPIPVFRRLNITKNQKRGLMMVFSLGGVVCIFSAVRLYSLLAISDSKDPTFDNTLSATMSVLEVDVGIVCTCLPALRPLLAATMPKYFQETPQTCCKCHAHAIEQPEKEHHISAANWPYAAVNLERLSFSCAGSIEKSKSRWSHIFDQIDQETRHRPGSKFSNQDIEVPIFLCRTASVRKGILQDYSDNRQTSSSLQQRMDPLRMSPPSPQGLQNSISQPKPLATIRQPRIAANPPWMYRPQMGVPDLMHIGSARKDPRSPAFHKPLPITPLPLPRASRI